LVEKQEKIIKLIEDNPTLSGNQIYLLARRKGLGIGKSKFYALFRKVRDLPEPTEEKKEKSIPIKYKFPTLDKIPIPKKEGYYGIVEVIDKDTDVSYWIKYTTRKSLKRQFQKIKKKYKPKKLFVIFRGLESTVQFETDIFTKLLVIDGVIL